MMDASTPPLLGMTAAVMGEWASGSAAIFILLYRGADWLAPSKFYLLLWSINKPSAHNFPSCFPSITLEKLKSQVGELSEKNGLSPHSSNRNDVWEQDLA